MFRFSPLRSIAPLAALLFILFLPGWARCAGIVIAGQTLGTSTWDERSRLTAAGYQIDERIDTPYKDGPALRLKGRLAGRITGTAELFYDGGGVLVAARVLSADPAALLKRLGKSSRAQRQPDDSWHAGDWRLRIIPRDGQRLIYISTQAFDDAVIDAHGQASGQPVRSLVKTFLWYLAALLGLFVLGGLLLLAWARREALWKLCPVLADYVVGLALAGAFLYHVPQARLGLQALVLVAYCIGHALVLTWALRTVRVSGWLPRLPLVELLWALPATPLLLLPVVARNAIRSPHYAGLLLFFAQLAGLVYYFFRPGLAAGAMWLAAAGLFGAGIVRLYCMSFDCFPKLDWRPAGRAALALFFWPAMLAVGAAMLCWTMMGNLLAGALLMLFPAVGLGIAGAMFDVEWMTTLAMLLPFAGLLPGVVGVVAGSTLPTGYSGMSFDGGGFNPATGLPMMGAFDTAGNAFGMGGFDFNPANGMPMIGGMGGFDVMGNSFGMDNH